MSTKKIVCGGASVAAACLTIYLTVVYAIIPNVGQQMSDNSTEIVTSSPNASSEIVTTTRIDVPASNTTVVPCAVGEVLYRIFLK